MANRSVVYNRTRDAARQLVLAIEEARAANKEFITLGGTAWTNPFFYVGESSSTGALRDDLDITPVDLANAQVALDVFSLDNGTATPNGHMGFLDKVK